MKKNISVEILKQHFDKKKKDFPGLSSHWLASKLSVSQSYISQILNGNRALPQSLIDPICKILDIDAEKKDILIYETLKAQGWVNPPSKGLREGAFKASYHARDWVLAPNKDLKILNKQQGLIVLEATQLKDYNGNAEYLAQRLELGVDEVRATLQNLKDLGFLKEENGKLVKAHTLLEFQSGINKKDIAEYHRNNMRYVQKCMDEKTTSEDLERRLITSAVFTCSKDQVSLLKAKIAEFLKELTVEAATSGADAEEVYQLGISLCPLTHEITGSDVEVDSVSSNKLEP